VPDLVGHIAFAAITRHIPGLEVPAETPKKHPGRATLAAYYLGAALPDLLTRPFHISMPILGPYLEVWHSPACVLLWGVLLGRMFVAPRRAAMLAALMFGAANHLVLDLIQKHIAGGYLFLFPFSLTRTTLGVLWPEQTVILSAALAAVAILIVRRRRPDSVSSPISG